MPNSSISNSEDDLHQDSPSQPSATPPPHTWAGRVFALIGFHLVLSVIWIAQQNRQLGSTSYLAAQIDKHQMVAETATPKLLLVGDSTLTYGLDSKILEKSLGIRTINIALMATLGAPYHFREAKDLLRSGDSVLLSQHRRMWSSQQRVRPLLVLQLSLMHHGLEYLSWADIAYFLDTGQHDIARVIVFGARKTLGLPGEGSAIMRARSATFRRASFDESGNAVAHCDYPSLYKGESPSASSLNRGYARYADTYFQSLRDFVNWARANEIFVYFTHSPYRKTDYPATKHLLHQFNTRMENDFPEVSMVGNLKDTVYEDDQFFDSPGHLLCSARQLHTMRITQSLMKVFAQPSQIPSTE